MSSLPSDNLFELARHVLEANQLTRYALCKSLCTLLYDASVLIVIIDLVSSAFIIFYDYGEFFFFVFDPGHSVPSILQVISFEREVYLAMLVYYS